MKFSRVKCLLDSAAQERGALTYEILRAGGGTAHAGARPRPHNKHGEHGESARAASAEAGLDNLT